LAIYGSGVGASVAANKAPDVRAALIMVCPAEDKSVSSNDPFMISSYKGTGQYAVDTLELAGESPAPGAGSAPG